MQKKIIIAIVILALLAGGVYFLLQNKSGAPQTNVVTSIKDALSQSASMECTYTDQEGRESKSYIKNGAMRTDYKGKTTEESGSVIVTAKKMYMWTEKKEGFMIDIPEVTPTEGDASIPQGVAQRDEAMADLEKYKESCKTAVVSDSLFTPPSDVQFQDYSQMMQQVQQLPTGGAGMSEEQVKQYMEQYSNPQE
jgi:hypothetical protein